MNGPHSRQRSRPSMENRVYTARRGRRLRWSMAEFEKGVRTRAGEDAARRYHH